MTSKSRRPERRTSLSPRTDPFDAAYYESRDFSIGGRHAVDDLRDLDDTFVFDYQSYDDDLDHNQRWSNWDDLEALCKGPEPRPDWVVTSSGAIDTELGILKTGKEAEVFLLERADPHDDNQRVVMAAKRYRTSEHSDFKRASAYTEGRSVRRSRDERALKANTTWGKVVASMEWAGAEWNALRRAWEIGVPVPYPVQIDGTEILMEWISSDDDTAPRLAQTRPERELLQSYFDQLREGLALMVQDGWVHGDLSPYNILAAGERLVIIDLPQIVSLTGHPDGFGLLHRDCANVCRWFHSRGLEVDPDELYADLVAHAF